MDKKRMDDEHLRLFLTEEQFKQITDARKALQKLQHFHFGLGMVTAILGVWLAWVFSVHLWDNQDVNPGIAIGSFLLGVFYMWKGKPDFNGK